MIRKLALLLPVLLASLMTGCNLFVPGPTSFPTVATTQTPTVTPSRAGSPSPTFPPTVTPTASPSPEPPTAIPSPSETPGPYEYTIKEGDISLIGIVSLFGHRDLDVMNEVVRINDNVPSINVLPPPGSVILIPRPTGTPTPPGYVETIEVRGTLALATPDFSLQTHTVQSGETAIGIILNYNTTLRTLCALNPLPDGIDCGSCDLTSLDPDCDILLRVGQALIVPGPTPTPTITPTFSGQETATPTPTFAAPLVLEPINVSVQAGVTLRWVSVGILPKDAFYFVSLTDTATGQPAFHATQATSWQLPPEMAPPSGEEHVFEWQVTVSSYDANGNIAPLGGASAPVRFSWQG